jgi:pilus assembly protein CpaE
MASEPNLRVALAGSGPTADAVAANLARVEAFEVVPMGGVRAGGSEVIVLVHDGGAEPREELAAAREHSSAPVVLATAHPSSELVRWAIDAGLADVLPLPASPEQTLFVVEKAARTARQLEARSRGARVVTVFSPKGGSGKSVVATNLAVAAATHAKSRTLLVDLDLQFGDAAIMLGLTPRSTVRELIVSPADLDAERLDVYTERHASGVHVLPAPMNPEDAELVGEDAIRALLGVARQVHDLVVVDTAPFFYGPMLATLDQTDQLLVVCNPDVPTLKNVRLTLKTLELLSFPEERLRIVLNRASAASGMDRGDVEAALERRIDFVLPLDPSVPLAVNGASAAVVAKPDAPFSAAMLELARAASGAVWTEAPSNRAVPRAAARILSLGRS